MSRVALVTGSSSEQRRAGELCLAPLALYALLFFAFTFPLLARFSTHFFANDGDGLSNVWNLWWVGTAVTRLRTWPWFTAHLHFPHGTTLLGHTLNPFNGFVSILLEPWLGLVRAHNTIVIFAFVFGAYAAFRLALHVSGRYAGSLVAGFVFGFSTYHFAHAEGHLNLVSLEWIPLFLLAWICLLERPSASRATLAAFSLLLVLLCDYYYFFYCVLAGALVLVAEAWHRRDWRFWLRAPLAGRLAAFVGVSALTSGVLVALLLWTDQRDPFMGEHDASQFSLDLLALWIPGGTWRFHELSEAFWSRLPGNTTESSVHLGVGVTLAALFAWRSRARPAAPDLTLWWVILGFFAVMSLGPSLQIWGRLYPIPLPYRLLEQGFPPLRVSGVPVRMVVMVTLAAGILAGAGIDELLRRGARARVGALLLMLCMVVELLPRPLTTTDSRRVPGWVAPLAALPKQHGFMDATAAIPSAAALYFQTLHEVPMFEGFIARVPASVFLKSNALRQLLLRRDFASLCQQYGFAYFLLRERTGHGALPVAPVWMGEGLELYDVRTAWVCRSATN